MSVERNPIPPCLSHLEQAEQALLRRVWHIALDGCLLPPDGGSPTEGEIAVSERIANAIRDLMPGTKLPILGDAGAVRSTVAPSDKDADALIENAIESILNRHPPVTELVIDPLSTHLGGMSEAERELLLSIAGWLAGALSAMPNARSQSMRTTQAMRGGDAAGMLMTLAEAVRKESEG